MRRGILLGILFAFLLGGAWSPSGDGSDGWTTGESLTAAELNELDTAVDDNDSRVTTIEGDNATQTELDSHEGTSAAHHAATTDTGPVADCTGTQEQDAAGTCFDGATQAELDAKSAATSTDNAFPRFDSTSGDLQDSQTTEDDSGNVTVSGDLSVGSGSGATCLILRDSDNAGDSACEVLNGTFTCETDTNGICGDAT